MSLSSSFGPLGWRKIISNQGGSTIITKDGQLIASSIDYSADGAFLSLLWKDLILAAERSGDGIITNSTLILSAIRQIDDRLAASFAARIRIRLLRVLEALQWIISQHEPTIRAAFVDRGIWMTVADLKPRLVGLVRSVVIPSSNGGVATDVIDILIRWLRLSSKQVPADDVIVGCRRILTNFDTLVQVSIGKFVASTRCFSFTSEDEIIIKGRCRDYSALANSSSDQKSIRFVCITHMLPAAYSTVEHTIQIQSADNTSQLHDIGHSTIQLLIEILSSTEGNTRVIFCCDAVNDEAMQLLAQSGFYLIDCIPPEYLSYIARRTGCPLHLSPSELLSLSRQTRSGVTWGRFHHLERTMFGARQEVYYKICDVKSIHFQAEEEEDEIIHNKKEGNERENNLAPLQVVLRGASSLSVGVHVRMLQRSLKTIIFSLTGASSKPSANSHPNRSTGRNKAVHLNSPDVSDRAHLTPTKLSNRTSATTAANTVVPGAGAGELGWSLLWRQIANNLSKRSCTAPGTTLSEPTFEPTFIPSVASNGDIDMNILAFEEKIQSLVDFLSDALFHRVGATYPEALSECASLCALLSDAYLQVPLQCVVNSLDVLPDICTDGTGCESGGNVRLRTPQAALLHWESGFCRAGEATGRVGLVVEADPLAEGVCAFQDALCANVYTSYNHFWSGFLSVLNALRLRLRVGEVIPVKKRQELVSRPTSEDNAFKDDEDVDADIQSFW